MSRVSRERNRRGQPPLSCPFQGGKGGRQTAAWRIINEICYRPDIYTRATKACVEKEDEDGRGGGN